MIPPDARLLRLYVNAADHFEGKPVYEVVVMKARAMGLAGASVFPVELSYGSHHRVHDVMSEYTFVDIPVVVEIVDAADKVRALLAELQTMVPEGLATVNAVRVARYAHPVDQG